MACGFAFAGGVTPVSGGTPRKAAKSAPESKQPSTRAGSGRMQVEEPKSAIPMGTAKESRNWQKNHARGLTEAQKLAFRERKEKMEGMIEVIKEKRKALRDAKPEERAVLARELHSLILEKDPDAAKSGATSAAASTLSSPIRAEDAKGSDHPKTQSPLPPAAKPQEDAAKKAEAAEQRRQRIESYQLLQQKKEELRRLQIEKQRSGLDYGGNTRSTFNSQAADEE